MCYDLLYSGVGDPPPPSNSEKKGNLQAETLIYCVWHPTNQPTLRTCYAYIVR